jgi:hypothetical protein
MILAILARHFNGDFSGYYNAWCSLDSLTFGIKAAEQISVRHSPEALQALPVSKITSEHHVHFTAAEVWSCLNERQRVKASAAFRMPGDVTTSAMAGVLLWLASLEEPLYSIIVRSSILDAADMDAYIKAAKAFSVRAKSFQNLIEVDLRPIFELEVLANRAYGAVDWEAEREHRIHPNTANLSPAEVEFAAMRLFSSPDTDKDRPVSVGWDEYWKSRWQWSAAGSIHSQYQEDLDKLPEEYALRTKFIAIILEADHGIQHYINRPPEVHAWASTKYEWAKMRAIYGTDVTSYILTNFAFMNCEDTLPKAFPVGKRANPSFVSARVAATLEGAVAFTLDYEDFNSQHSTESMQAVMRAWVRVYKPYLSAEQIEAAKWAIASLDHVVVHDNTGLKTSYESRGTLMSGWRLTSFVNSVLNYIYTHAVAGNVGRTRRSVHNGDDVLMGVSSFATPVTVLRNAKVANIRLQRAKCNFGGLAEFLRVDHVHGSTGQYLARNISTLVHSRIESRAAVRVNDVIDAMEVRFSEYVERGGDMSIATRMRDLYYERMSKVFNMSKADMYTIKIAHRVVGGISTRPDAPVDMFVEHFNTTESTQLPSDIPGVTAYAKAVQGVLELTVPIQTIIAHVRKATLNAVQKLVTNSRVVVNKDAKRCAVYRSLHKAYVSVNKIPTFGKAMLTGFAFDVISRTPDLAALRIMLHAQEDPMRYMSVVL